MGRRRHLSNVFLITIVAVVAACGPPSAARERLTPARFAAAIDTTAIRADTWFLAHDRLRGRGTGTAGADAAGLYIQSRCLALGLATYALPVPLLEARVAAGATQLTVADSAFRYGSDFILAGGTSGAFHGFDASPMWVGATDDILADGRLPPLDGRVALTLGPVRPDAARALEDAGAVAMIHLLTDPESFVRYVASRGTSTLQIADPQVPSSLHPAIPSIIAHPVLSRVLALAAQEGQPVSFVLRADAVPVQAFNVACTLPGHDREDRHRWIAYTAHYDHLGVGPPDASGDSIYNGFSDNAAGVAMLLGIAGAIRAMPERSLGHSMLLLFFTGEERGLLGSDYYVHVPFVPLDSTTAVINLDAGAPPARVWNWRIAGGEGTALGELARDVAAGRGWAATTSLATANSDYFPFVRRGVSAVFIIPGAAPYEGLTSDSSQALRRRWDRYHQPGDEWHEDFPFEGLARYAEYALLVGLEVDRRFGRASRVRD